MERHDISELKEDAKLIRADIIRMVEASGSGHPGGSLSSADIMATLFFNEMRHDPKNPEWPDRDRFILSKGHCTPVLYATLARAGYIPKEEIYTFRKLKSRLQGHPGKEELPLLEASTGSLGQGLSVSVGMALAAKLDKRPISVYCLMGDGEQQEGMVWEAAMSASHFKLDNLCAIVDVNKMQLSGTTEQVMNIEPLAKKYKAFGWRVIRVNGHRIKSLLWAFRFFKWCRGWNKPVVILADTIKGKGVGFMEGRVEWHGQAPNKQEALLALKDILGDTGG
ncbi:transketolase [Candidatus Woesearchaeota archaeon]|nr:transketolase [Candidatus Woesearchaeota archaeon]